MIKNKTNSQIVKNKLLNDSFLTARLNNLDIDCKIFKGNFFLDSLNYFPITEKNEVFQQLYLREDHNSFDHFYTKSFFQNFSNNINNFTNFNNVFILGSSIANNYYSNLLFFLPRIYFFNQKNVKILISRSLANNFRFLIKKICKKLNVNAKFVFIDEGFFKFTNSNIPQFLKLNQNIKILRNKLKSKEKINKKIKLYVTRQETDYRNVLNESDVIENLKKRGFKIINPLHYKITEQIKLFSSADTIISPHGSNLANIIFCDPETKIFEIGPNYTFDFEKNIKTKYEKLANLSGLKYFKINADTVNVKNHSKIAMKYVSKKILDNSSHFKNMIVKLSDIDL